MIVITDTQEHQVFSGNYNENQKFTEFCNALALKSSIKFTIPEKRNIPIMTVATTILSATKTDAETTLIDVPENPFIFPFSVNHPDFTFSANQHIWYTDSYPASMLIGDGKIATTILKHYQKGWISKPKYEYYQLNNMSRAIYDKVINESKHNELYNYLNQAQTLSSKIGVTLIEDGTEYTKRLNALVKEYKNVIKKSLLRSDLLEMSDLTHPDYVRESVVLANPWNFIPSNVRRSQR